MRILIAATVLLSCAMSAPLWAETAAPAAAPQLPATAKPVAKAKITPPQILDAWISEAPPVAKNNAAYVVIQNGNVKDALTAVETPAAANAELHQMSMAGGLMRMQRLPRINLAAGQKLSLAAGSRHIMLIDMKQPLKAGDKVPLTLVFRKAGRVTVQAEVRPLVVNDQSAPAAQHESTEQHHH
ncbi:MAG: copper chaperone PCu(A)C [Moraxellaceae bacterium]